MRKSKRINENCDDEEDDEESSEDDDDGKPLIIAKTGSSGRKGRTREENPLKEELATLAVVASPYERILRNYLAK